MKILMTTQPGIGHLGPMLPIARELASRGIEVTIATAPSYAEFVRSQGLQFIAAGLNYDEGKPAETLPDILNVPQEKQARWLMDKLFLDRAPRAMIPDLLPIVRQYDLVIHNNYEFAGAIAAEKMGVPYVCFNLSFLMRKPVAKNIVGKALQSLRKDFGLPKDKNCDFVGRYLDLRTMPLEFTFLNALTDRHYRSMLFKSWRYGRQRGKALQMISLSAILKWVKWVERNNVKPLPNEIFVNVWNKTATKTPAPHWLASMPKDRPSVYVSLGTVFNRFYPNVFKIILDAVRDMNINLIMTVGKDVDIASFGPQPPHIYIKNYVDQTSIMPFIDLCLIHGGYSTTMLGLNLGIPQVILPLSGDQPIIASIVNSLGAGVNLPFELVKLDAEGALGFNPDALTKAAVKELILDGLDNQQLRQNARALQATMAKMCSVEDAVDQLLARFDKTPSKPQFELAAAA